MIEHDVVIAGGGPTGMMLAAELTLAGTDVVVVERRTTQEVDGSRAGGLHARTIEVLDQRGVADRFLAAGEVMQTNGFAYVPLDIGDFPTRHPYGLALWQREIERLLAGWIAELGVPVLRGREVIGVAQHDEGVDVALADASTIRARYLVGCDGGRSVVRKEAGIDFPGLDPSTSWMIAQVEMDEEPEFGFRRDRLGQHAIGRRQEGEPIGVVLTEASADRAGDPTIDELRAALVGAYGTDFGLRRALSISRFTDATRQAATYRRGRVLLAGDAAHVHPPQGGQGLNTGVQDAVNLGWKLAQVVAGVSPDRLLDTYHDERHPVGQRVLRTTRAQVALGTPGEGHQALREVVTELIVMDEPRRHLAGQLSGLDIRYDLGPGHPLVGRRVPDLDLRTAAGPTRVFELLHDACPLLLDLRTMSNPGARDVDTSGGLGVSSADVGGDGGGRLRRVVAECDGVWELPVVGVVDPVPAVLVRPDGHVAWTGELTDPDLPGVVETWFGAP